MGNKKKDISRQENTITIHKLRSHSTGEFYDHIRHLVQKEKREIINIKIAPDISIYPNHILPIIGVIEYYKDQGININFKNLNHRYPDIVTPRVYSKENRILGRIWKFSDSQEVSDIVSGYRNEFEKVEVFTKGILQAMEWALNEVMDNVLQHSCVNCGYVMAQYHQSQEAIALCVFDYGQGIKKSFSKSNYSIETDIQAIELAIQEGVTRDKSIGQGNGLFGLISIINEGEGQLNIKSGKGIYSIDSGNQKHSTMKNNGRFPCLEASSTLIDFQLKKDKEINLSEMQFFKNYNSYSFTDLHLENFEDDVYGYLYDVSVHSEGTGTRQAGIRAKNQILNIIRQSSSTITLDFSNVEVISSSYADELIVKLLLEVGLFQFNKAIRLKGMSDTHKMILERSFRQRIQGLDFMDIKNDSTPSLSTKSWGYRIKKLFKI